MLTIAIAAPKGGSGNSTLACALSVRGAEDRGSRVAMLDMDESQGTLTEFWVQRGRSANPYLYDEDGTLDRLVEELRRDGYTHCFIDGPPHDQDLIEMSVLVSDVVLLPTKLSYFDASSIDSVIAMCRRRQKPYAFVINEYDGSKKWTNANNIGLELLRGRRSHIMETRISSSPKHRVGQLEGRTGAELDTKIDRKGNRVLGPIAKEIDDLWAETLALAGDRRVKPGLRGSN